MGKFFLFLIFFSFSIAFSVLPIGYSQMANTYEYRLTVDDHSFSIPYTVAGKVIAMDIDPEVSSLLIGLEEIKDSTFTITLSHDLINSTNNDFTILIDGFETDYDLVSDSKTTTFTFFVPEFTEEIEIIGTHVVPEFPIGPVLGFTILISLVIFYSRIKIPFRL